MFRYGFIRARKFSRCGARYTGASCSDWHVFSGSAIGGDGVYKVCSICECGRKITNYSSSKSHCWSLKEMVLR